MLDYVQSDFELAVKLQNAMLPESVPVAEGYSFWAFWQPAAGIGGDLYDFQTLLSGEILVVVADVSGKTSTAALGMAFLAGIVPFAISEGGSDLCAFAKCLNESIFRWASRADRFITMFIAALNPVSHKIRFVNAAHVPPLIRGSNSSFRKLLAAEQADFPLGLVLDATFHEMTMELQSGDTLLIVTDGILSVRQANGEACDALNLSELPVSGALEAKTVGSALLARIFAQNCTCDDDVTIVSICRNES